VNRRFLIGALIVLAGIKPIMAHTPYGQWVVYRKKHLLIGSHRADPKTYEVAKQISKALETHLPKAKSRVARAPTAGRLASLIGTNQMDVAVLNREDAVSMLKGERGYEAYGPIPIRCLAKLGGRVLIAHIRFPNRHAWLVTAALADGEMILQRDQSRDHELQWHPGSLAFLRGEAEPSSD